MIEKKGRGLLHIGRIKIWAGTRVGRVQREEALGQSLETFPCL